MHPLKFATKTSQIPARANISANYCAFTSDNIIVSKNAMKIYPKILSEIGAQCKYSCNKSENSAGNQVWILYALDWGVLLTEEVDQGRGVY